MNKYLKCIILMPIAIAFLGVAGLTFADDGLSDSPWPGFHGNKKHTGLSNYDTSALDGSVKWRFKTEGRISTSPAIAKDGTIYITDEVCNLYAISPAGKEVWKFDGGDPITSKEWGDTSCAQSSPAIDSDGTIYWLPMSGNFYAVNPDGSEKWSYEVFTFKNSWTSPAITPDGTIIIGSEAYPPAETGKDTEFTAKAYAFNPDGTIKWSHDTGSVWVSATASIGDDGTIYTAGGLCDDACKNVVYAFNTDGSIKWTYAPENGVLEGSISIGPSGTLYFTAKGEDDPRNAYFYALNSDGSLKWREALNAGASITPGIDDDENLYFGDWDGLFMSYDKDGNLRWTYETEKAYETLSSSPAIGSDGTLYFGSILGDVFALTLDGKLKWTTVISTGGGISSSPAIAADGTVYIGSQPGELVAFGENSASVVENIVDSASSNSLMYVLAALSLVVLVVIILLLMYRQKWWLVLILIVLFFILAGAATYLYGKDGSKSPTNSLGFTCPDQLLLSDESQYQVEEDGVKRALSNDEFNWVRENCEDTEFPGTGEHKTGSETDTSVNSVGDSVDCPHHVYGKEETGYQGAYGMDTKDMTDEDVSFARESCPNTTWPDAYDAEE